MKTYEVVRLPYAQAKEQSGCPLERLAVIAARSYREACQTFRRLNAWVASTNIWRVRQVA